MIVRIISNVSLAARVADVEPALPIKHWHRDVVAWICQGIRLASLAIVLICRVAVAI